MAMDEGARRAEPCRAVRDMIARSNPTGHTDYRHRVQHIRFKLLSLVNLLWRPHPRHLSGVETLERRGAGGCCGLSHASGLRTCGRAARRRRVDELAERKAVLLLMCEKTL
jgi:hypothetical protein